MRADIVTLAQSLKQDVEFRTVWERIRDHLESLHLGDLTARDTWPVAATQDGIAAAIGKSRSHVALEMGRGKLLGHFESYLAHVKGAKSRRLVYRRYTGDVKARRRDMGGLRTTCPKCGTHIVLTMEGEL